VVKQKYELYRQLFYITEWRDGCVFRTRPAECGWYPESTIKANEPRKTNLIYSVVDVDFMTIRIARKG
jgi:hypothetical protein